MATAYDKCVLSMQVKVCRCHQKKWGLCYMCKLSYVGVTERNGDTESAASYSNQLFYSPDHALHWLVISHESTRNRDTLLSALVQQCHMNIHMKYGEHIRCKVWRQFWIRFTLRSYLGLLDGISTSTTQTLWWHFPTIDIKSKSHRL